MSKKKEKIYGKKITEKEGPHKKSVGSLAEKKSKPIAEITPKFCAEETCKSAKFGSKG
jgi:hypothetical protein